MGQVASADFNQCTTLQDAACDGGSPMSARALVVPRSPHPGIQDLWQALAKPAVWWADHSSDTWNSLVGSGAGLRKAFDLFIAAEVVEVLHGLHISWIYCLKVYFGHELDGRSTFSSAPCIECPPKSGPKLIFSGSHFDIMLWPLLVNRIGRALISSLTGRKELVVTEEADCQFHLAGELHNRELRDLELRVSWRDGGVLQSRALPFSLVNPAQHTLVTGL